MDTPLQLNDDERDLVIAALEARVAELADDAADDPSVAEARDAQIETLNGIIGNIR
jgi:hypothetical protein